MKDPSLAWFDVDFSVEDDLSPQGRFLFLGGLSLLFQASPFAFSLILPPLLLGCPSHHLLVKPFLFLLLLVLDNSLRPQVPGHAFKVGVDQYCVSMHGFEHLPVLASVQLLFLLTLEFSERAERCVLGGPQHEAHLDGGAVPLPVIASLPVRAGQAFSPLRVIYEEGDTGEESLGCEFEVAFAKFSCRLQNARFVMGECLVSDCEAGPAVVMQVWTTEE